MKPVIAITALVTALLACASLPNFGATDTPYPCPQATAEIFYVEPIPATTDQTTLTVKVVLGNLEEVTVVTESGTFTSSTNEVEVTLLPGIEHNLEVIGQVREVGGSGGCTYGGYTLNTTVDKNGAPLIIKQTSESTPECIPGTQQPFNIEPIPSTTTDTKITITGFAGDHYVVETESGVFSTEGYAVEVTLLPNTLHHLKVTATFPGACGGTYTQTTTIDRDGNPLVIEQQTP